MSNFPNYDLPLIIIFLKLNVEAFIESLYIEDGIVYQFDHILILGSQHNFYFLFCIMKVLIIGIDCFNGHFERFLCVKIIFIQTVHRKDRTKAPFSNRRNSVYVVIFVEVLRLEKLIVLRICPYFFKFR